ncbi:hypothetical protein OEIGOIKO_05781 [Streptomyces chrestomyceticus JCM 4735]|uniref:DUF2637 domain-containing protein n=1 Tax=Streptomyces chrestomyceticus JCM 4735 TaxID=1306181 RepID=A0A7U9L1P5_9ACTN|nr:hypothetical protein OEIGOIKO_05781 [Streptomyces chrestomyceticus JCM 4735]
MPLAQPLLLNSKKGNPVNRNSWRLARLVVGAAALGVTGWSLYVVGRHYGAPVLVAAAGVAVFDGAAYACQYLASEASAAGRSAVGARLASLAMLVMSIYLNIFHATLIHGGVPAAILFSAPSLALQAISELAWAGPRAQARKALGERPFRLPTLGGWAWLLAPKTAGGSVRKRALAHISNAERPDEEEPEKPRGARDVLREQFASMDPARAVRIVAASHPHLSHAELASLLIEHGVVVDAVDVALALDAPREHVRVERVSDPHHDAHHDAPQVGELPPLNKAQAIVEAASRLGDDATAAEVVRLVHERHRLKVDPPYVRTVLSRESKKKQPDDGSGVGQGGGGYA